jgi:glycosyltransferase involved in cell wall biosynthesis
MKISVVIPTYIRSAYLIKTIREVVCQAHPAVCELIVIDQTPTALITANFKQELICLQQQANIIYIHRTTPNLPAARNAAIAIAKGEILIMLDDDVLLPADFIEEHYTCYLSDQNVICVAGLPYHRKDKYRDRIHEINLANFQQYTTPHFKEKEKDNNWKGLLVGANHSVLKTYAIASGGYDEGMFGNAYYEDSDFIQRFRGKFPDKIVVYNPAAFVVHLRAPEGGCRRDDIKKKETWLMTFSTHVYMWRYTRSAEWRKLFLMTLRMGPFRKDNVLQFWKQPRAWHGFIKSLVLAYGKRNVLASIFIK